jgi:hypothetical protein
MEYMIKDYLYYKNDFVVIKSIKMDGATCIVNTNNGIRTVNVWDVLVTMNDRLSELGSDITS